MLTRYEYDAQGRVTKVTDPDNHLTRTEYDPATGKQSATIDKNNVRTEYDYDDSGNLEEVRHADGTSEHHTYDAEGNKLTTTDRDGNITGYAYDETGRLTHTYYCGEADT